MYLFIFALIVLLFKVISKIASAKGARMDMSRRAAEEGKEYLVVTAHPDDESMFMVPTIKNLVELGVTVKVLCFSNGNFDGLGKVREKEMGRACKELGVKYWEVIDDPRFEDGMQADWDPEEIASEILKKLKTEEFKSADVILTFDEQGISSHPNHIALFRAVQKIIRSKNFTEKDQAAYALKTTGLVRKYLGPLDHFFTSPQPQTDLSRLLFSMDKPSLVHSALKCHETQYVWFRKLFVTFSRYASLNEWVLIK